MGAAFEVHNELAYRMQTQVPDTINIDGEPEKLKEAYGIGATPTDSLARRCLLESNQSMESIATLLGYYDAAAFRKAFRNLHGIAPGEYRERFPSLPGERDC